MTFLALLTHLVWRSGVPEDDPTNEDSDSRVEVQVLSEESDKSA